jgi:hypothetical protein
MSTIDIDFKSTYFQHSSLTKIYGEPTFQSLQKLYKEIKANATLVSSTLGGGLHGYLGLVVTPANYARTQPNHVFTRPPHPGALNIAQNATQYQIAIAKDTRLPTKETPPPKPSPQQKATLSATPPMRHKTQPCCNRCNRCRQPYSTFKTNRHPARATEAEEIEAAAEALAVAPAKAHVHPPSIAGHTDCAATKAATATAPWKDTRLPPHSKT